MEFLYILEGLRTPFLDKLMLLFTELGGETAFLAAVLVLYWCVNKRQGIYLMAVGFLGTISNQFLKLFCRVPRPWVLDPGFSIVEAARAGAGGYSFPSGHSTSSVGTFGSLALCVQKRWQQWLCVFVCFLVPLTRMYLGVHTPADVLAGSGLALVFVFTLRPVVFSEKKNAIPMLLALMILLGFGFLGYVAFSAFPADIDPHNLQSAEKNSYTLLGALLGMVCAYFCDERFLRFPVHAPWYGQIAKVAGGLALVLAVKSGLKAPLEALFAGHMASRMVRYFLVVLVAGIAWPMTFPWFARLGRHKEDTP